VLHDVLGINESGAFVCEWQQLPEIQLQIRILRKQIDVDPSGLRVPARSELDAQITLPVEASRLPFATPVPFLVRKLNREVAKRLTNASGCAFGHECLEPHSTPNANAV
jgi:hypothetical protein